MTLTEIKNMQARLEADLAADDGRRVGLFVNTGMVMPSPTGWRVATQAEVEAGVAWRPAWGGWRA